MSDVMQSSIVGSNEEQEELSPVNPVNTPTTAGEHLAASRQNKKWTVQFVAEQLNFHHSLQANTVKKRRVLSHIYLGREVIDDERYTVDDEFIIWVLHELPNLIMRLGNL